MGFTMANIMYAILALVLLGFAGLVLWRLRDADLSRLICEPDGKASVSRLQLLIFTFVVAGLFLVLSLERGEFVEVPNGVLGLLGISGGGFLVSKGIGGQTAKPKT